jgi:glycosyltransferase involved in cell wall biosynthesis
LLYGALAARLAGVPRVVHTQHHGQLAQITRRQASLVRLASHLTHRFVCVSADSAQHAIRSGVASNKVAVVHNCIDLDRFAYRGPTSDGPAVTIARLHPLKGIDVLLQAVAEVVRVDPSFRLEIAGAGPCGEALRKRAAELNLDDPVRFLGEVRDIPALLARARLFVLPSFSEGVSLTLLEAMATGLPALATRVGGNPEVVVPGETGLLVPSRDPAALARALLQLWSDEDLGRRLGQAGRRRVEEHFDLRRMMAKYERLYDPGRPDTSVRVDQRPQPTQQATPELLHCA